MKDGVVTNMLTGAPACMSNKIHKGDRVVMVDEKPIDALGVGLTKLLTGCDIPGAASLICIHVLRYTGRYIHVCIPRYFKILNTYLYMRYVHVHIINTGSIVSLKVQRGASNVEVQLKRACTTDLADKKSFPSHSLPRPLTPLRFIYTCMN